MPVIADRETAELVQVMAHLRRALHLAFADGENVRAHLGEARTHCARALCIAGDRIEMPQRDLWREIEAVLDEATRGTDGEDAL